MAIQLNKNWDLSVEIKQVAPDNTNFQTKLPGRFDPETATKEKILTLVFAFIDFTGNTFSGANLTAHHPLESVEEVNNYG